MLIHRRRCHENNARVMSGYKGVSNDSLEVLLVFIQWDVLVVLGLGQRGIVCTEENNLCISAFSPTQCLSVRIQYDIPGIG